jgi:hypothetical protein
MRPFALRRKIFKNKTGWMKSNRGSSSVLVILIMVTLIVLGLIALMSTFSELKLARKNAEWVKTYYALDGKAENLLSRVDSCLKAAADDAGRYISGREYEKAGGGTLPADVQTAVNAAWSKARAANAEDRYLKGLYARLYYLYSLNRLKASDIKDLQVSCKLDFESAAVFEDAAVPEDGAVVVSSTVTDGAGPEERKLLFEAALKPVGDTLAPGETEELYELLSWKEVPKKFEYEDSLDFEDLEVE